MNTICEIKNELMREQKKDTIKRFYVYHLIDPADNLPFYVGKGTKWRMYRHESDVINGKIPNGGTNIILFRRINEILETGKRVVYRKVYEQLSNDEAKNKEKHQIKKLKEDGIVLCNCTEGGDDRPSREEIGKRHSLIMMGHKVTDETKKKMSIGFWRNRRKPYWDYIKEKSYSSGFHLFWKGKARSIENKERCAQSKLGEKNPMYKKVPDNIILFIVNSSVIDGISYRDIKPMVLKQFGYNLSCNKIGKLLSLQPHNIT